MGCCLCRPRRRRVRPLVVRVAPARRPPTHHVCVPAAAGGVPAVRVAVNRWCSRAEEEPDDESRQQAKRARRTAVAEDQDAEERRQQATIDRQQQLS